MSEERKPISERIKRDVEVERTGEIFSTTEGRCYNCNARVGGKPDAEAHFPDIDTRIELWVCYDCWKDSLNEDEASHLGLEDEI